ncbi:hypothetical protein CMU20_00495 [Elizabethkingia anophelis]|nr:hypothetical protein [Elizabethkingia anophelis]
MLLGMQLDMQEATNSKKYFLILILIYFIMKLHTNTLVSNLSTVEMINIEGGVMPWKNLAIAAIVGGPLGAAFYLGYYNGSH